ncbi:MAG: NAD(+) synthase [Firmicutes bacterium]|nr:NAD(+) synthase [Bacillota bacterium]
MNYFFNLYHQGFIRAAAAVAQVRVADPTFNVTQTVELARQAAAEHAILTVFPELNLSAYSNQDLFHQQALLETTENEIKRLLKETATLETILVVGAPVTVKAQLYNCALVLYRGRILGIVPKSYLPNFRQLSESRQFRPGFFARDEYVTYCGQANIPFGSDLLFKVKNIPNFIFAVEICEDLQVPVPPSSLAALAGATVIVNPAASGASVGRADRRHTLISNQSARCLAAYLCTEAGLGESTTDLAWDGHALIYENGQLLAETQPFAQKSQLIFADLDLDCLCQARMQSNIFSENAHRLQNQLNQFRTIEFEVPPPQGKILLKRQYERFPYIPAEQKARLHRCRETFAIQVQGLVKRLLATGIKQIILGISGGLDSTWALVVAAKALDYLGLPRTNIRAYTMPGFATSARTKENAWRLIQALGVTGEELDIRPGSLQMLKDIGHPAAGGEKIYDTTYENVQAGQRTALLFRLANRHHGLVLGTGDLSEIALGWTTYGVGDHMSHYNVNAGVPKTLIQHLIYWYAKTETEEEKISRILLDILNTEISPELIPGTDQKGQPAQRTEDFIGPYELQDFNLYYTQRGYRPSKVAFLAYHAWRDKTVGQWPDTPENMRTEYTIGDIKHWLQVFCRRFYGGSQFKRSAMPDGPQVGPGPSLSPRGGWRAPSDAAATVWLNDLKRIPDTEV